ncbi:MAG: hypothetical protein HOW97_22410 [Catenulispora sp.]|nr:hypothetical protein [Catenulispora sp.]
MCTYQTFKLAVSGSAKGPESWIRVTEASVYYDHPSHAVDEHTLNIDLRNPERGPSARIAVELSAQAAYDLAQAILTALESVPEGLLPDGLLIGTSRD